MRARTLAVLFALTSTALAVDQQAYITPVGKTSDEGHNFLYLAMPQWQDDVFGFLDEHVKR